MVAENVSVRGKKKTASLMHSPGQQGCAPQKNFYTLPAVLHYIDTLHVKVKVTADYSII